MTGRKGQAASTAVYIILIILYAALALMPELQETDHVRRQIRDEMMIQ